MTGKLSTGDYIELDFNGELIHGRVMDVERGEGIMDVMFIANPDNKGKPHRRAGVVEGFYLRRYTRHLEVNEVMKYKLHGMVPNNG